MQYDLEGTTTIDGINPHYHEYSVDIIGNGRTTKTIGRGPFHIHHIENFQVMPGGVDFHTHKVRTA